MITICYDWQLSIVPVVVVREARQSTLRSYNKNKGDLQT